MFDNFHFRRSHVVLITEPSSIFISIGDNRTWITINLNASDVFACVWNLTKENRLKI